jgi:hypothetical protein
LLKPEREYFLKSGPWSETWRFQVRQPRTIFPGVLPALLDRASGVCVSGMIDLARVSASNDGSLLDLEPRTFHGQSMMDDLTKRELAIIALGIIIAIVLIINFKPISR